MHEVDVLQIPCLKRDLPPSLPFLSPSPPPSPARSLLRSPSRCISPSLPLYDIACSPSPLSPSTLPPSRLSATLLICPVVALSLWIGTLSLPGDLGICLRFLSLSLSLSAFISMFRSLNISRPCSLFGSLLMFMCYLGAPPRSPSNPHPHRPAHTHQDVSLELPVR